MALLYNRHRWIHEDAFANILQRNGDYADLEYDLASHRLPPDGQMARDERWARLIDITSTNSHYSALQFLRQHNWDLTLAVDAWFREGGLPIVYPPMPRSRNRLREDGLRLPNVNRPQRVVGGTFRRSNVERDTFDLHQSSRVITFRRPAAEANAGPQLPSARINPVTGRIATPPTTTPGSDRDLVQHRDHLPKTSDDRGAKGYPSAALVNLDISPPQVNCPDPTKLYFEYILRGKYRCQWFEGHEDTKHGGRDFEWHDGIALDDDHVEFDWFNKKHIDKLKKWRNNIRLEQTGEGLRESGDKMNKYEEDWLREQEAIRHEEQYFDMVSKGNKEKADALFSNARKFPLKGMSDLAIQDITRRFNELFAGQCTYRKVIWRLPPRVGTPGVVSGTMGPYKEEIVLKDMSKVGEVPRPARKFNQLRQHRHRVINIAKHFILSYEYKSRYEVEEESQLRDDSDSDFWSDEESDEESDPGPERPASPHVDPNDPYGGYRFHEDQYDDDGFLPREVFHFIVAQELANVDPRQLDRTAYARILGIMTEFYRTHQGVDEQNRAYLLLGRVRLGHLNNLNPDVRDAILGELERLRDAASDGGQENTGCTSARDDGDGTDGGGDGGTGDGAIGQFMMDRMRGEKRKRDEDDV